MCDTGSSHKRLPRSPAGFSHAGWSSLYAHEVQGQLPGEFFTRSLSVGTRLQVRRKNNGSDIHQRLFLRRDLDAAFSALRRFALERLLRI